MDETDLRIKPVDDMTVKLHMMFEESDFSNWEMAQILDDLKYEFCESNRFENPNYVKNVIMKYKG